MKKASVWTDDGRVPRIRKKKDLSPVGKGLREEEGKKKPSRHWKDKQGGRGLGRNRSPNLCD